MSKARKSKTPKEGSRAWELQLHNNPQYVREVIGSLVSRAAKGDKEAAESLAGWLRRHPEMRTLVRQLDDLCVHAEIAWIKAIAGGDKLREQGVREEVERIRAELLGDTQSVLDRLLASNLVVSYLANQHALLVAAQPTPHAAVAAARDRRAESTQRRLLTALKTLALIRGIAARGLVPRAGVRLFSPERVAQ